MATEKREGLKVRGYERWMGKDVCLVTPEYAPSEFSEALGYEHHPLVRLSDAQAEIERAREAGRVRGLDQALEAIIRMEDSPRGSNAMYHACKMAVAALLPSPPPEGGPDAD